ncbi:uncharacterized protein LOC133520981 [Cydia pomonella]|uniref:uncharacterized protein LOC133520981 n=1 Tax=Cydia pomonella TaxID=82600 RepID=UPI002ADDD608|nr:uncharacterized protein LOC133520981 [Cydia pomonella]
MAEPLNRDMECENGPHNAVAIQEGLSSVEEQVNQNSNQKEGSAVSLTVPNKDLSEDRSLLMQMEIAPGELEYGQGLLGFSSPSPLVLAPLATPGNLQVIRSTRFMDNLGKEIKLYRTRGLQRGVLVLFSYSNFTTGENFRDIASDNEMLTDLFRQIGFKLILRFENQTKRVSGRNYATTAVLTPPYPAWIFTDLFRQIGFKLILPYETRLIGQIGFKLILRFENQTKRPPDRRTLQNIASDNVIFTDLFTQIGAKLILPYETRLIRDMGDNKMLTDLFRQIGFKLILRYENKTKLRG